jgi:hypothetical protein
MPVRNTLSEPGPKPPSKNDDDDLPPPSSFLDPSPAGGAGPGSRDTQPPGIGFAQPFSTSSSTQPFSTSSSSSTQQKQPFREPEDLRSLPSINKTTQPPEVDENPKVEIDMKFFIPPDLTLFQMWGPTVMILAFLGLLVLVLMWLYIYVNFNLYQDRITVLSLGNLFNQNPQASFKNYIQQTTQESISAAMQDITLTGKNVQSSVNRLQSQMDTAQKQQQGFNQQFDNVIQPVINWLQETLGPSYLATPSTVKTTATK